MVVTNVSILIGYLLCAIFTGLLDWEYSDDGEDLNKIPSYIVINLVTWWLTIFILAGRFIRHIKRERRRKK